MPRGGSKPGERRGGRQKGTPNKVKRITLDVKALAGASVKQAIDVLSTILGAEAAPLSVRIMAAREILDRGCGKAPQALTGPDGSSPLSIVVKHIYEP